MFIKKFFGKARNITKKDLNYFLNKNIEDKNVDFKEFINKKKTLIKPLVGFANAKGGILVIGVSDDKKLKGIKEEGYKEKLNNWIKEHIQPPLLDYNISSVKCGEGVHVYLIEVEPSRELHAFKDEQKNYLYYIRKGNNTEQIIPQDLKRIAVRKEDYEYNEKFRKDLILTSDTKISEIARFLKIKPENFLELIESKDVRELIFVIKKATMKDLSINIFDELCQIYIIIFDLKNATHKNLSYDEETGIKKVFMRLAWALGFPYEDIPNKTLIEKMNNPLFIMKHDRDESLDYLVPLVSLYVTICWTEDMFNKKCKNLEEIKGKFNRVFFSYEYTLDEILNNFNSFFNKKCLEEWAIEDIEERLNKFPSILAKELINVINSILDLKTAVNKELYLE